MNRSRLVGVGLALLLVVTGCATQPITGKPARGHGTQVANMDTAIKQTVLNTCVNSKGRFDQKGEYELVTIFVWNISNREPFLYWVSINSDPPRRSNRKGLRVAPLGPTPSRSWHNDDFIPEGANANDPASWAMVEFTMKPTESRRLVTIAGQNKEHLVSGGYTLLINGVHNNECTQEYRRTHTTFWNRAKSHSLATDQPKNHARRIALGKKKVTFGGKSFIKPNLTCESLGRTAELASMCVAKRQELFPSSNT
jgi:hypothetical protein